MHQLVHQLVHYKLLTPILSEHYIISKGFEVDYNFERCYVTFGKHINTASNISQLATLISFGVKEFKYF